LKSWPIFSDIHFQAKNKNKKKELWHSPAVCAGPWKCSVYSLDIFAYH
jgi:hypothetical protein